LSLKRLLSNVRAAAGYARLSALDELRRYLREQPDGTLVREIHALDDVEDLRQLFAAGLRKPLLDAALERVYALGV